MTVEKKLIERAEAQLELKPAIIAGVLVFLFWLANLIVALMINDPNVKGTLGDAFGISNALFSGLALAGVIYAIWLQRKEISIAKSELAYTKQIFDEQTGSLRLQNAETKKQIFENTFFQLLRLFTELTAGLKIGRSTKVQPFEGKDVFEFIERELPSVDSQTINGRNWSFYAELYEQVYKRRQNELGHYFRTLYNIFKFIDVSDAESKRFYANIVRAQLSNSELHLLLYNGLSRNGVAKFKPLIERYSLFDNLPLESVRYKVSLFEYEASAFGGNAEILRYLSQATEG